MTREEVLDLFDQYHDQVYRLALTITRSHQDGEDMVQTVFLKLLTGATRPQPGKEKAWLCQITVNCCRDLLRARKRRAWEPLETAKLPPVAGPEERELLEAVLALPDKYRAAVHLHYYEGYTTQEIGAMLGVSPSAVSMRLHRARKLLEESLKEEFYEDPLSQHL